MQAINDVERIAADLYTTVAWKSTGTFRPWAEIHSETRSIWLRTIEDMLARGVIKVGVRPQTVVPMHGQITIEEAL